MLSQIFFSAIGRFCRCFFAIGQFSPVYICTIAGLRNDFPITGGFLYRVETADVGSLKRVTELIFRIRKYIEATKYFYFFHQQVKFLKKH
jgi:hypothetical protein